MRRALATRGLAALLAAILALGLGPAARARAADDDAADGGKDRVAVAVFLVSDNPIDRKVQALLMRGFEGALKQNERLDVKDKDLLLAEFAGEVPEEAVGKARDLYTQGLAALVEGRSAEAVEKLTAAEKAFEPVLAYVKKNELADCQFYLGAAYAAAGDRKKARATLARLQTWRTSYQWDAEKWSSLPPLWDGARQDVEKGGRGSLEISSDPDGAMAFVDGKYLGVTPTSADGLPVGDHYVTLKLEGYQRKIVKAHVDPHYQELVTEQLPASEKYLLVQQSLDRARAKLGDDEADVSMLDLRTFLFIDMAVFLSVEPGKGKALELSAYLYDLRSKRRLSEVHGVSVQPDRPEMVEKKLGEMSRALFANVRYDGRRTDGPKPKKKQHVGPTPVYEKWWFWTGIALGAAAVATPIIFYDDIVGPAPPSCPGGTVCTGVTTNF